MRKTIRMALVLPPLTALVLSGCGGGSGDSDTLGSSDSSNFFACVVNNGTNPSVTTYRVSNLTGALGTEADAIDMTGKPPQWVVAHPSKRVLYVTAYDNRVHAYAIHATSGALTEIDSEATGSTPGVATVTPDGRFLYVGNIHSDAHSISAYSIDSNGYLTPQGYLDMGTGHTPNDLIASPDSSLLYAMDNTGTRLNAYTIGYLDGSLTPSGSVSPVASSTKLAVRLGNLYANEPLGKVHQFTDDPDPLTALSPVSITASGTGSACTVVGDHLYRYALLGTDKNVYTYAFDSAGDLTEMSGPLALDHAASFLTGGLDGTYLYSVHDDADRIAWSPINAGTGIPSAGSSTGTKDRPACMTVIQTQ